MSSFSNLFFHILKGEFLFTFNFQVWQVFLIGEKMFSTFICHDKSKGSCLYRS